jgi:hypothetical protein
MLSVPTIEPQVAMTVNVIGTDGGLAVISILAGS